MPRIVPTCVSRPASSAERARPKSRILTRPAPFLEPDVGRLDVAVDQPLSVGRGQSLGDLAADPQDLGDGEPGRPCGAGRASDWPWSRGMAR